MTTPTSHTRRIMLVDALNTFTRYYVRHPQMSSHGEPVGGVVGFLNALKRLVEEQLPTQVIVVWEGGGSMRRRQLYPEYKQNRRPIKMNRYYEDDIPNTVENRNEQVRYLVECMKCVPVCQLYVTDCEADDVIAYLCRTWFKNDEVIIVSSDSDMYQLLDDKTRIFRPGKKVYVDVADVLESHGVHPRNFALAKAVCGDGADNVPGISGVGYKTLSKRVKGMQSDVPMDVESLLAECHACEEESRVKAYRSIIQGEELIRRNVRLVDLDGTMLGHEQRKGIDHQVDTFEPAGDKVGMFEKMVELGILEFDIDEFFYTLSSLMRR